MKARDWGLWESPDGKESYETLGRDCCIRVDGHYQVFVIHANILKAEALRQLLIEEGVEGDIPFGYLRGVIGTHLVTIA